MGNPVFTIGHSTHSEQRFFELLSKYRIDVLADVRSIPHSRFNPQFNRETLERSLKKNGFRYVFLGKELGARSEDRSCYLHGRVQYARLAQTTIFQSGIDRVIEGSKRYQVVLMCSEKEPLECHRTLLVARALVARNVPVFHIQASGQLESHEKTMDRLLNMTKVPDRDLFRSPVELLEEALAKQEEAIAFVDENLIINANREGSK